MKVDDLERKVNDFKSAFCGSMTIKFMLLLNNKKLYTSQIAKTIPCTFSHTVKIIERFKKEGLVKFSLDGRIKYITLTPKGAELAKRLQSLADFKF